jgi:hypothetical protein
MNTLLAPVMALVAWTHVMWLWMYATRLPAIMRARMAMDRDAPSGEQMASLPSRVRWKADNYNHLFEQPTVFYAVALALALLGDKSTASLTLAWAYVSVRVMHSLWQALLNIIVVRFAMFVVASLILMALTVRAAVLL